MESHEEAPVRARRPSKRNTPRVQPDCILTIGTQSLAAVLAEESESSFSVLIQGNPLFWVDEAGILQTDQAEAPVKVSNIVFVETAEEDELATDPPTFRVGLARLGRSEGLLKPKPVPHDDKEARASLVSRIRGKGVLFLVRGLIALVLIATPLAIVTAVWHQVRQTGVSGAVDGGATTLGLTSSASACESNPSAPDDVDPPPEVLTRPGVEPFLNELVAKKLALTPSQTGAFERLNHTTLGAMADLEKNWESTGRLEIARRRNVLFEAVRQESLQLLSEQQRRQWEAMTR